MSSDQPEIVAIPRTREERHTRAVAIYRAALAVADQGKAVKYRFEDWRTRDAMIGAVQRLARMDGYRANTQSTTNDTALFWIDKSPSPRGTGRAR